jgi:hypothetical protein
VADPTTILRARLAGTDRVLIVDGPRASDGYEWFQVKPIRPDGLRERPFGWLAAGSREGQPWIAAEDLLCPDSSDIGGILRLAPEERLACYGGRTIQFRASDYGCGSADGQPITFEPEWLKGSSGCGFGGAQPGGDWLMLRFPPGASQGFGPGLTYDVIGHFDDPAAATCKGSSNDPDIAAPSNAEAVVECRTEFVVESLGSRP